MSKEVTKFRISANDLLIALDIVSPAVSTNPVIPITDSVLLTNREIKACNSSLEIRHQLPPYVSEPFSAVINFQELWSIASNSKGSIVEIEQTVAVENRGTFAEKSFKIKVMVGDDVYKLNGEDADNFLSLEGHEPEVSIDADAAFISEMGRASVMVGTEDNAWQLTSLILTDKGEGTNIVGSDVFIIYAYESGIKTGISKTVPINFVKAISKLGAGKVSFSSNTVSYESESTSVYSLVTHAALLDFTKFKNGKIEPNVFLKKDEMLLALSKVSSLKNKEAKLSFNKNEIEVFSQDPIYDKNIKTSVSAEVQCVGKHITINVSFLTKLLKTIEGNEIKFQFRSPKDLLIVQSANEKFWGGVAAITPIEKN